jgi:glycosyltransferase involved in cell wall biosynthesis
MEDCLRGLVGQTYTDWEAIIVDDASPDPIDVSRYQSIAGSNQLRVVRLEKNQGVAAARNAGVLSSRGELLFMHDADDYLEPRAFEFLNEEIGKGYDCAFGNFHLVGEASGSWRFKLRSARDMVFDQWIPGPGVLMKKGLFDRIGGYCEEGIFRAGNEDWDFWMSAMELGAKAGHVSEVLYNYRVNAGSLSNSLTKREHFRTIERMFERHRNFIADEGLERKFLYEGYYWSIRNCAWKDLWLVFRKGMANAATLGEGSKVITAAGRKIAKAMVRRMGIRKPQA